MTTKPDFFAKSKTKKAPVIEAVEITGADDEFLRLSIEQIDPDPEQPRREWEAQELDALTDSVMATKGCRQPIRVRTHPDNPARYMIVDGEGRWTAHTKAVAKGAIELKDINAIIGRDQMVQPSEVRLDQLISNMARYKMHYLDEAAAVYLLVNDSDSPIKKGVLAKSLGVTGSHISRLLKLHMSGGLVHEAANYTKSLNLLTALADLQKFVDQTEFAKLVTQVKSGSLTEKKAQKMLADFNAGKNPNAAKNEADELDQTDMFTETESTAADVDKPADLEGVDESTNENQSEPTLSDFYPDDETPPAVDEHIDTGGVPLLTAQSIIHKDGMVTVDCGSHLVWIPENVLKQLCEAK